MGTEQFTKIQPVLGSGSNVKLAHALVGEPVSGTGLINTPSAAQSHIQLAGLFSTAPYVDPSIARKAKLLEEGKVAEVIALRSPERERYCVAKGDTCKGWAGEDGLCAGHRGAKARGKDIGIG